MSTSSVVRSSLRQGFAGRSRHQTAGKSSASKSRTSIQFEDAVATISLAALSTTVLALVCQSFVP
jgi:hypothetical protein